MKSNMSTIRESYLVASSYVHTKISLLTYHNASKVLLVAGAGLLAVGLSQIAVAQTGMGGSDQEWAKEIQLAMDGVFSIIEGSFGALVMVVSGLAAIIAAAMGAYRAAMGCLVVAVGAFILRSMVRLFFGDKVDIEQRN
ncbi:MAG: hypothetical protein IT292_12490 [Deltaproteobacteria bacterium]|nr:hypothetical protein [Deltaproteobacteria bacterium]